MPGSQGPQIADFWVGMASIPILGTLVTIIFKSRTALSKDILELQKALAAHQLHAAEKMASKTYVKDVDARFTAMFDKLDDKFDKLVDKVDKVLERVK